jgi:hypothetical protein
MPTVTSSGGMDSWDSVDCDVGHNMPQAYATWDQGESLQRFNTTQVCAYI